MAPEPESVEFSHPNFIPIEDIIPPCNTCIPQRVESHPHLKVVRCANCKQWLG